ncbi:MAG: DUF1189 family protein [Desulfobacterales bacterium]|jgi:hypothetical protein
MQRYRLIFDGQTRPSATPEEVRQNLAALFRVRPDQIEALFAKSPVILKEDLDYQEALEEKADFEATGALCRLERQPKASPNASPHPSSGTASQAAAEESTASSAGRRYRLWHSWALSFFAPSFYIDVARHWRGLAFVHLLLVLVLSTTVYVLHFSALMADFIAEEAQAIIDQVPEIRITAGKVSVDVEEPYTIRRPNSGEVIAVIDTTGEITSLMQTDAVILLTESRLAARFSPNDRRNLDLGRITAMEINQAMMEQWLRDTQKWLPLILFPLVLGFAFVIRSVQALLYGGIAMVLASMLKIRLPLSAAVSIAIMAMTPVLLLDALMVWRQIVVPFWGLGGFLLAMGYLVFGIRSVARHS